MFRFEGIFVEDFPTHGVWHESDSASYDVILKEKAVLSSYFEMQDAIFERKDKVTLASGSYRLKQESFQCFAIYIFIHEANPGGCCCVVE